MADLTTPFSPEKFAARIRSGLRARHRPIAATNQRAFDSGWGGAVWKTFGEPIINVNSRFCPGYGSTSA